MTVWPRCVRSSSPKHHRFVFLPEILSTLTEPVMVASAEMTSIKTSASKQWSLIHWSRLAETSMPGLVPKKGDCRWGVKESSLTCRPARHHLESNGISLSAREFSPVSSNRVSRSIAHYPHCPSSNQSTDKSGVYEIINNLLRMKSLSVIQCTYANAFWFIGSRR